MGDLTSGSNLSSTVSCDAKSNTLSIDVGINFTGRASGNSAYEQSLLDGIGNYINGTYARPGHQDIAVDIRAHAGNDLNITLISATDGSERSYMDDLSSTSGTWYTNANDYVAGHEVLHAYGLDDTYIEIGKHVIATPGIMGTYGDHMNAAEATQLYQNLCVPDSSELAEPYSNDSCGTGEYAALWAPGERNDLTWDYWGS